MELGRLFPSTLSIGIEIRTKLCEFVEGRIAALRAQHPGQFENVAVVRTNAMKYLPNYFARGQLRKVFFLFPDPHFKRAKHKWRIISPTLLAEYAYVMAPGGDVYVLTDVRELFRWMTRHLAAHPLFRRLDDADVALDPLVPRLWDCTEEGQKVTRAGGEKYLAVFRRIIAPAEGEPCS